MTFIENVNLNLSFAFSSKNIPVCETRVMHGKKGMPWNDLVAVHPLPDGRIEVTPVDPDAIKKIAQ
jgi:hypothetical protein